MGPELSGGRLAYGTRPMNRTLSEAESTALLAPFGIPFAPQRTVSDPRAAAEAAAELGFPVVAKLCGDQIAHKTERGLVRLGLGSRDAVEAAAADLLDAARPEDGPVEVLVAPMISGTREFIAGMSRDPQFGPTVMVGVGGVLTEALGDATVRLVPLDRLDAREMIDDLRSDALLGPLRGEPAVDREALAAVAVALSAVAAAHPEVTSIDLNPLIISDGRPVAVDALVEIEDQP